MDILKRGTPPSEKEYDATCRYCDTKVRFKKKEAIYVPDQRDGDALKVTCPVCKRDIFTSAR